VLYEPPRGVTNVNGVPFEAPSGGVIGGVGARDYADEPDSRVYVRSESALVAFSCVLGALRTRISRSICNSVFTERR
jgi:hypothetical protein